MPTEPEDNQPNVISVLFKLPNGSRVERRFRNADTMKVSPLTLMVLLSADSNVLLDFQDVYHFLFCHPLSPDAFEITTNFPKRVLDTKEANADLTLSDVGLQNREVLFVKDLDA